MAKKTKNRIEELLEGLARSTKTGFDDVNKRMDEHSKVVLDEFQLMRSDIGDIKRTLGPLVKFVAEHDNEIQKLHLRLSRVERRVGLTK